MASFGAAFLVAHNDTYRHQRVSRVAGVADILRHVQCVDLGPVPVVLDARLMQLLAIRQRDVHVEQRALGSIRPMRHVYELHAGSGHALPHEPRLSVNQLDCQRLRVGVEVEEVGAVLYQIGTHIVEGCTQLSPKQDTPAAVLVSGRIRLGILVVLWHIALPRQAVDAAHEVAPPRIDVRLVEVVILCEERAVAGLVLRLGLSQQTPHLCFLHHVAVVDAAQKERCAKLAHRHQARVDVGVVLREKIPIAQQGLPQPLAAPVRDGAPSPACCRCCRKISRTKVALQ
mmetsp:Transcript_7481/g.22778  ORF Transcript_7481/g.22778 Transcript_7481/m.22778 type:complete len:286 (+) Transcript_7481:754-1611(+)